MGKKVDTSHIVTLNDSNYQRWKLQVTLLFKATEVWDIVSGATPRPDLTKVNECKAWDQRDIEAQAIIVPLIDEKQTSHIEECTTSSEIWEKLKNINSDSSVLNKQHTLTKFYNYKTTTSQSAVDAYTEVERLARALKEMGLPVDESMVVTKIVSSLPNEKYLAFKKAWDSVAEASQSMEVLLSRLRKEELENQQCEEKGEKEIGRKATAYAARGHDGPSKKYTGDKKKKTFKCYNCNRMGHMAKDCHAPKRKDNRNDQNANKNDHHFDYKKSNQNAQKNDTRSEDDSKQKENPPGVIGNAFMINASKKVNPSYKEVLMGSAFMVNEANENETNPSDVWLSDSGASVHITGRKDWYEEFTIFQEPRPVSTAGNGKVLALGIGKVKLDAFMQGQWIPSTLSDVLYIPGAVNLFSEAVMAQKGYVIIRTKDTTRFLVDGIEEGPEAFYQPQEKIYIMRFRQHNMNANSANDLNNAKLWHDRLSHINLKYIHDSVEKGAVKGISIADLKRSFNCEECHLGKETRKPFPIVNEKRNTLPGEMMHADLSGKMPTKSLGGSEYFLLIKDDATGFLRAYFLKHKNEAADCVKLYIKFIETQTGNKVKCIRTDNGTEFICQPLTEYLEENGIIHERTVPYCPESNAKIEREMRTVKDASRAMLQKYNTPEFLWAEAVGTAVYILNRILNKKCNNKTAFEEVFDRVPDLAHIKIFGCKAYAQVPTELRRAWDAKAKVYTLVGYESTSKHYRLYDSGEKKIIIHRNVTFDEDKVDIKLQPKWVSMPESFQKENDNNENNGNEKGSKGYEKGYKGKDPKSHNNGGNKPSSSEGVKDESLTIVIETAEGTYETEIPAKGKTKLKFPMTLRDREKIKPPAQYRVNVATELEKSTPGNEIITEPRSYKEAINSDHKEAWKKAMQEEYNSLMQNETWILTEKSPHMKCLDSRWLFKVKKNSDGTVERLKARLVIKGYLQRYGIDYTDTFSCVCRFESVRLLIALAAINKMTIKQFDVKTAFLNAHLEEYITMNQPEGFNNGNENEVCLLKRALYGMKQSPRAWGKRITSFLKTLGLNTSASDPSVFIATCYKEMVYLLLYVDDGLLISKDEEALEVILEEIQKEFTITIVEPTQFLGIGINYDKENGNIHLNQEKAVNELLEKYNMHDCKKSSIPMQPNFDLVPAPENNDNIPYRELLGSLLFIARTTRPDIAFAVSKLAQFGAFHDETHWKHAKTVLRYLKGTASLGIEYGPSTNYVLTGYSDSDYAGDRNDRKSTTGYIFLINDSPISWSSKKQPIVTLSSTEAEYVALCSATKEAMWYRRFLEELNYDQTSPTDVCVDNTSAIKLAHNPEFHERSKHIDVKYHFTRERIEQGEIQVPYVPTTEQKADILTKPLMKSKHEDMRKKIGMTSKGVWSKTVLWTQAIMMMICLTVNTEASHMQPGQPLLWRKNPTPITNGYDRVYLRIKLNNPCELLTPEVLHTDITKMAQIKCNQMYNEHFIHEMEQMCPIDYGYKLVRVRRKRFIIITGMIIASVVLWAGAGTALGLAISSTVRTSELAEIAKRQAEQLDDLENRMNVTALAVRKLQEDFNTLVHDFEDHVNDFNEFKGKQVETNFRISYITARFVTFRQVIREANRQWKNKKVYAGLLDYMNLTLACGDLCPIHLATAKDCFFHSDLKDLYLRFDVPKINPILELAEVDTFKLMLRTENKTCVVKYTGPAHVIISKKDGCTYEANLKMHATHDLILSPSGECEKRDFVTTSRYFGVERCDPRRERDEQQFIQIKPHHGSNYIYCPGSMLTVDGQTEPCPDHVFVLPISASFKINNADYIGSDIHVEHAETVDPLFTLRANRYLQPRVNYSDLMQDPLVIEKKANHGDDSELESMTVHPMTFTTAGCLVIILILVLALAVAYYRKQKGIILSVVPKPVMNQPEEDTPDKSE